MRHFGTLVTTHISTTREVTAESLEEAVANLRRYLPELDITEIYRDEKRVIFSRAPYGMMPEGLVIITQEA